MDFTAVTKDQFFMAVGPRDIVTRAEIVSRLPYCMESIFETRSRTVIGKITNSDETGAKKKYLLSDVGMNLLRAQS